MVNPTGYTALDMIGFTDKGPYSSSDNYVKNDLVHYSGNIWRCLIDDTTGIAPAEGVRWTLFIGEPTNLVERIIAPVETDPATNAWAVGRQIIYNDNLYEVITAITAGDALVAYEDDPTNANIKLADPVETQLLNESAARAAADLALQNSLTNRNLLDNPWFTVNQRGAELPFASGTAQTYFIDRWYTARTNITSLTDGVTFKWDETNGNNGWIQQKIPIDNKDLIGKTVTLSAIINNELFVLTGQIPTVYAQDLRVSFDDIYLSITNLVTGTPTAAFSVVVGTLPNVTKTFTVKAVKLEVGSVSTLAMDTAPNYATELLKCQNYFQRLGYPNDSTYEPLGSGFAKNANLAYIFCPLRTRMRIIPTVTLKGKVYVQDVNIGVHAGPCTINASTARGVNALILYLVPDTADRFTAGNAMSGYFNQSSNGTPNSYIDLSADL